MNEYSLICNDVEAKRSNVNADANLILNHHKKRNSAYCSINISEGITGLQNTPQ